MKQIRTIGFVIVFAITAILSACSPATGNGTASSTTLNEMASPNLPASTETSLPPTPTPDLPEYFSSPYAGPVPEGAIMRLGKGYVREIVYSPDGKYSAIGTFVGVYLYDAKTYQLKYFLDTGGSAFDLSFSKDSSILSCSSTSYSDLGQFIISALFWDVNSGEKVNSLQLSGPLVIAPEFNLVATSPDSKNTSIFSTDDKAEVMNIEGTSPFSFSPDGKLFINHSRSSGLMVWDMETKTKIGNISSTRSANDFIFAPDGKTLAFSSSSGTISLVNTTNWQTFQTFEPEDKGYPFSFSADGKEFAYHPTYNKIAVWDVLNGKVLQELEGANFVFSAFGNSYVYNNYSPATGKSKTLILGQSNSQTNMVCGQPTTFSPDEKSLACITDNWNLTFFDTSNGFVQKRLPGFISSVVDIVFAKENKLISAEGSGYTIAQWDSSTGERLTNLYDSNDDFVESLSYSDSSNFLAAGFYFGKILVIDLSTGNIVYTNNVHSQYGKDLVSSVALSPDGKYLASATITGEITLQDATSWQKIYSISTSDNSENWIDSLIFTPDGKYLISGSSDNSITFWNLLDGSKVKNDTLSGEIISLRLSPDGNFLAASTTDNKVIIFDLTADEQFELMDMFDTTYGLAFSPDGKFLATDDYANTMLWDTNSWKVVKTYKSHNSRHSLVAFSPDSKILASGSNDGTIVLWNIDQ